MNLQEKKAYVDKNLALLPESEIKSFEFNFACVFTKNSVGMAYSLTPQLEDVVQVIRGGSPANIDEGLKRDLYNFYNCHLKLMNDAKKPHDGLTEDYIKDLHSVLVKGIFDGGLYRQVNVSVPRSRHTPCDSVKVYDRMHKLMDSVKELECPIERACYAHLGLCKIHPFLHYNGRLARLILNYMLVSEGFLPISIPAKRYNEYFATLEIFKVEKNPEPFYKLVKELLDKEYDRMIELIQPFEN